MGPVPQVLTFAGQETHPAAHPSALPPEQVCGPVRSCYEIEYGRVLNNRRAGAAWIAIAIWFVLLFLVVMAFSTAILVSS